MRFHLPQGLFQDAEIAARGLRRSPAFTLVAISSLALGIGANTAIFSFVDAILLKRLPVPEPQRLVQIREMEPDKFVSTSFSYPFVRELATRSTVLQGVLGRFPVRVNFLSNGVAEPLSGEVVTGEYFKTLEVKPALGRLLNEEDIVTAAANPVCVISYSMWQERFAGDPSIIGRTLMLNSHAYHVIGVTEKGFNGAALQSRVEMQLPVSRMGDFTGGFFANSAGQVMWRSAGFSWLSVLARLRPGVTRAQAQAALQALARQIKIELADPNDRGRVAHDRATLQLLDGSQGFNFAGTQFASPLTVLMGIAGLVLLIACANLANLLLARAATREKEFAMRLSLGASRFRVIRQLMVESFAIACCGGLAGVAISFWVVKSLLAYLNAGTSAANLLHASPDMVLLSFSAALSLATALLFGLVPAWQASSPDILPALKEASGTSTPARRGAALRKSLIVFQLALSLVILFAAGLLTRTLRHLQTIDLGFRPAKVIAFSVDPAMNGYSPARANQIFDEILARLRGQPGVAAASLAMSTPLEGSLVTLVIELPGHASGGPPTTAAFNMISPGYFATLDQPLLAGRDFSDHDGKGAPRVAIVNERFVSEYMPGENPIARHFKQGGGDIAIVGLVKTSRFQTVRETPMPAVYVPAKQSQSSGYTLLVQTSSDAARLIPAIEHTVHSIDPKLPIYNVRTLQAQIERGISSERILSFLSSLFSVLAVLLSGIGLYGIVAYSVSRRTREIGVRFAIGAQKSDVAGLFLRETLILVAAGIVLGIPVGLASTRVLKNLLYGLEPTDVPTLAAMTAVLVAAGLIATFLPVRRAAAIEPLQALRYE